MNAFGIGLRHFKSSLKLAERISSQKLSSGRKKQVTEVGVKEEKLSIQSLFYTRNGIFGLGLSFLSDWLFSLLSFLPKISRIKTDFEFIPHKCTIFC